jgi:uncharacterized membrane protein
VMFIVCVLVGKVDSSPLVSLFPFIYIFRIVLFNAHLVFDVTTFCGTRLK